MPPKYLPTPQRLDEDDDSEDDDIAGLRGESDSDDEEAMLPPRTAVPAAGTAKMADLSRRVSLELDSEPPLSTAASGRGMRVMAGAFAVLLFLSFVFFVTGGRSSALTTRAPASSSDDAYDDASLYSPTTVPTKEFTNAPSTVPSPDVKSTAPSPDVKSTAPSPDVKSTAPSPDVKSTAPSPDAASTPPSPNKTATPLPTAAQTSSPTALHVIDDSPVLSIKDPRYGPDVPVYSAGRLAYQSSVIEAGRNQFITVTMKQASNMSINQRYDEFCIDETAKRNAVYPFKYTFPTFPLDPGAKSQKLSFDPQVMSKHLLQYRAAVYEYREFLKPPAPTDTGPFYGGNRTAQDNRLGLKFAKLIASKASSLVIGFQGSSVMSGQDNCHGMILSETVRRFMDRLLGAFNMYAEVRNMGQNGDGPDMPSQMLCSYDSLGAVDLLVMWYWMIPDLGEADDMLVQRRALDNVHIWDMGGGRCNQPVFRDQGYCATFTDIIHSPFWSFAGGHWGRHGDGHCHIKTREGWPGVFMQNWHFGPLGFETLADQVTMPYVNGLIRAMEILDAWNGKGVPALSANAPGSTTTTTPLWGTEAAVQAKPQCTAAGATSPFITLDCLTPAQIQQRGRMVCFTGYGPRWNALADAAGSWQVPVTDARYVFEKTGTPWSFNKIKGPSRGNGFEASAFDGHPELNCSAFEDIGFAFQANGAQRTQWLTFAMRGDGRDKLKGATSMSVLACTGCRCGGWGHPAYSIQYGHNGQPVGPPVNMSNPALRAFFLIRKKSIALADVLCPLKQPTCIGRACKWRTRCPFQP